MILDMKENRIRHLVGATNPYKCLSRLLFVFCWLVLVLGSTEVYEIFQNTVCYTSKCSLQ